MTKINVHKTITLILQAILVVEILLALWNEQWFTALITAGIIIITLAPLFIAKFLHVYIPHIFSLMAIAFIFASLFLGEIRDYYTKFWWWDMALHTTSGFLLGITGFLMVHVLNETDEIGIHMKPGFVAFFAFLFAIGIGVIWEIFEYSMDALFGMNMQKPMLGDPSGLTDTMWDLIVDSIGALIVSMFGYIYIKRGKKQSFLERWVTAFITSNPRLFKKRGRNEGQ
ncbi:hypothetical protein CW740_08190 [Kangiella profundi]|uniref:Uncharacterized protein n=1 Tax=Kangiella profundi TaxID=1561924 RepID=A0A2K9AJU8_9GAMM|nr:hypothetical protein [Kangiella profundi]AUD79224.1 hypothetical protein CW740_08190 [Kangiella profundi]GGF00389.1 hypothetical protein GCM10011356_12660 [Kangiella profundi]